MYVCRMVYRSMNECVLMGQVRSGQHLAMESHVLEMKYGLDVMLAGSDNCKLEMAQYRLIFNAPVVG